MQATSGLRRGEGASWLWGACGVVEAERDGDVRHFYSEMSAAYDHAVSFRGFVA